MKKQSDSVRVLPAAAEACAFVWHWVEGKNTWNAFYVHIHLFENKSFQGVSNSSNTFWSYIRFASIHYCAGRGGSKKQELLILIKMNKLLQRRPITISLHLWIWLAAVEPRSRTYIFRFIIISKAVDQYFFSTLYWIRENPKHNITCETSWLDGD